MANKPLNISESAAVQMPMKTVASLILLVAAGVFAYTELTARLVSLETSRELFEADLLKKSEQLPTDQEQYMLIEDLYKTTEKLEITQEQNMTNKVNIEFLKAQLEKALNENFALLVSKCRGVTPARDNTRPSDSKSLWDDMKDDYKKENPDIKLMGDKKILKMPPKDYKMPVPE